MTGAHLVRCAGECGPQWTRNPPEHSGRPEMSASTVKRGPLNPPLRSSRPEGEIHVVGPGPGTDMYPLERLENPVLTVLRVDREVRFTGR